ncbi:hypothetical protein [Pontibacter chitinilyticus]|uniref:hypothetical protein n=1 Tax=Pontibacter chitinilyticus TaxID=2674989 RepID=UPI00321A0D4D
MAGLQADDVSTEFLRNFLTETLYLVPVDAAAPAPLNESVATPATPAVPEPITAAPKITPPAPFKADKPAATPAIPKLLNIVAPTVAACQIAGENKKGVLVLVTLPDQEFQKLPQLEFLQKILYAIGLQKADVAYVNNVSGKIARFEELQQQLEVNYIISFASRLDTELPHEKFTLYNPVSVGTVPVVFSQALSVLEHEVEHKKNLWNALRQMFL